eukprot:NODE_1945_length_1347_cov_39.423729_g1762_i0.p1 GENE.NODE_1945_length_1347_cov_39.423729_g1762_i0~~NODE_1945_length_1347_cov_39.423729_g1762_i0.p1  ORF type:complete len:394 (-),score=46.05 NODE_1945_length_1347_cov_39.423729_g1762_i0:50-1231(-)
MRLLGFSSCSNSCCALWLLLALAAVSIVLYNRLLSAAELPLSSLEQPSYSAEIAHIIGEPAVGAGKTIEAASTNDGSSTCPPPFDRVASGSWVARSHSSPPFSLFGLPMPYWSQAGSSLNSIGRNCDFRVIPPEEACARLSKVAFIGDSITMGFAQVFAEYLTQREDIILKSSASAIDAPDCFSGPLYDSTGHIRYKPCLPIMEPLMHDPKCEIRVHYLRVNRWTPGKDGSAVEMRRFLEDLHSRDGGKPIDLIFINFGLHHMTTWAARALTAYSSSVRSAIQELCRHSTPGVTVAVWSGITAQHGMKKPAQWRRLQSNERVQEYNRAASLAVADSAGACPVTQWDVLGMTNSSVANNMSWDGVHYVRHLNTMRTLVLLNHYMWARLGLRESG